MGAVSWPVLIGLVFATAALALAAPSAGAASDVVSVDFGFVPAKSSYCQGEDFSIEVTVVNMMASGDYVYDSLAYMAKVTNVSVHFYWMGPNEWAWNDVSNGSAWLAPDGEGVGTYPINLTVPEDACAQTYSYYFRIEYMVHLYFGNVTYAWGTDITYKDFTVVTQEGTADGDAEVSVDYLPYIAAAALVLSIGAVGAVLYGRRGAGPDVPGTAASGTALAATSAVGYPVLRPAPGEHLPVEKGFIYLVKERRPDAAFSMFDEATADGAKGMLISREHPNRLKQLRPFEAESILWLTHRPGKSHVGPTELSLVSHRIDRFVEAHGRVVVLIEGLEYLITHNDFETVLRFVNHLHDFVLAHDCAVIIVVDPRVLSTREVALLERSAKVVEPVGNVPDAPQAEPVPDEA